MKFPMLEPEKIFVILYSVSQDNIIVDDLAEVMRSNRRNISVNRSSDYVPVAAMLDETKARKLAAKIATELRKKGNRVRSNWHRVSQILEQLDPLSLRHFTEPPSQK
jgi:hypothetical protein